jgi:hypothetical protein
VFEGGEEKPLIRDLERLAKDRPFAELSSISDAMFI